MAYAHMRIWHTPHKIAIRMLVKLCTCGESAIQWARPVGAGQWGGAAGAQPGCAVTHRFALHILNAAHDRGTTDLSRLDHEICAFLSKARTQLYKLVLPTATSLDLS